MGELDYWRDLELFDFSSFSTSRLHGFLWLLFRALVLKGFVVDLLSPANGAKAPL